MKYDSIKLNNEYLFDSHQVDKETRFEITKNNQIETFKRMLEIYDSIIASIVDNLVSLRFNNPNLDSVTSYLINLSLLHNEMHNESFVFLYSRWDFVSQKFMTT